MAGDELQPGMVLCEKTPEYKLGSDGFQVEDMFTETWVESFMTLSHFMIRCG